MTDNCVTCDVVIVGSGFAGSLIANELSNNKGISVVILEAGPGIRPNINDNVNRFYEATAKVPESPYLPEVLDSKWSDANVVNPAQAVVGRPSALTLSQASWQNPDKAYLDQRGSPSPFKSTYERLAGGTAHWMGLTPRLTPNDFRMKSVYGADQRDFPLPDWPRDIDYGKMSPYYKRAEAELGVSANVEDQQFCGISFPPDYAYPMPRIPPSLFDLHVGKLLGNLPEEETRFLGMGRPVTGLQVRSVPAARNSQPYRNRRACAGNTSCIPICPIQAKYDATIALNEAMEGGVTLIPQAVASEILVEGEQVSGINFISYNLKTGETKNRCIKATIYVIAANGIETPRLLLMSTNGGRTPNGVANSSGMVGCNLMDHPQYLTWGILPDPIFPYRGPLVTSAIGELCDGPFRAHRAAFRISLGNDGWSATVGGSGGDPHVTTLDFVNGMNSSGLNQKEVTQLAADESALLGVELRNKLGNLISRQFRIAFAVEQSPETHNRVTLSSVTDRLSLRRPKISYGISEYTKQGIVAAFRMKTLIFKRLNATDRTRTGDDDPAGFLETIDGKQERLTYGGAGHVMGTYRMGDDPKTSVVNSWQCSHDHANLYLVGSGTFPTVGTANPTLTLSALALRTADDIKKRLPSLKG
jgi:choline dehydrogenase-like flavoprotein